MNCGKKRRPLQLKEKISIKMLARDWESDSTIRNVGRQCDALMRWPDSKCVGVAAMKACSLNPDVLLVTSKWWVQMTDQPSAINIDRLRAEAGFINVKPPGHYREIHEQNQHTLEDLCIYIATRNIS